MGPQKVILVVSGPEIIKQILSTRNKHFEVGHRNALRVITGHSVMVSRGKEWKQQRGIIKKMKKYLPTFSKINFII